MAKDFPEFGEARGTLRDLDALGGTFVEGLGQSMKALEGVTRELARSEVPVLLLAERGAGKRATAERIHQMSAHQAEPFRVVACADVNEEMLAEGRQGIAGLFGSGTVYLDELADLTSSCQEALLDVLAVQSNGHGNGNRARLICGSARDLEAEVKAARFREDTYYRISGVCLRLPPLRQRREDIPALVNFFLIKYAHDFRRPVPQLSVATQRLFQEYAWPGNIRELEDAAKAIVALGDESVAMGGLRSLLMMKSERGGNGERISLKQASRAASREAEKELILKVLNKTRWNRRRAAQELQISYKALLYKLKQIGYHDYGAS